MYKVLDLVLEKELTMPTTQDGNQQLQKLQLLKKKKREKSGTQGLL